MKRVAIYIRVSTSKQDTDNQRRELEAVAKRSDWQVVEVFEDAGISGAKGRDQRPELDAMMKAVNAKEFDMVASWSVDRLGRSLTDLLGVFKRGKGRKYLMADSAFKRMQVDAPGACWLDANEHHLGLALRTGGALNCSEWNDGRQALRLGHDASLEQAGAQHSLSPAMPGRRCGDRLSMRLRDLKRELIRRYMEGR